MSKRKNPTPVGSPTGLLRRRWVWVLCGVTAIAWQLAFPPFDMAALGYVMLVPWVVAVAAGPEKTAIVAGWVTGVAAFGIGLYWLTWITMVGYLPLIGVLSLYWLVAAWFVRRAADRRLPMWLVLPVAWTALELARAYVLSGFPWFLLAHSQYRFTPLIQIADLAGAYGVTFLLAMANGAVADAVLWRLSRQREKPGAGPAGRTVLVGAGATVVLAAGMLVYGGVRLRQAERTSVPGPRIAVVQSAVPISLGGRAVDEVEFFNRLVELTEPLVGEPLDLVVWPETVLPGQFDQHWSLAAPWHTVDPEAYEAPGQEWFVDYARNMRRMHADLASLLARLDAPLLAGGTTSRPSRTDSTRPNLYNSVMKLSTNDGLTLEIGGVYSKMHCVPFSEYVPFRHSWPWLHELLRTVVPETMPQLTPGERVLRYRFGREQTWTTATPICYEGVFARVCRRMAVTPAGDKIDVLTNMSNDGWFIWPGESNWASSELDQHLSVYVFRAIENRVPVVRAVNTGISGFIDSSGRIGTLVTDQGRTKMITGTATEQVLVDSRRSVYSAIGDVGAAACGLAAVVLGLNLLWRRRGAGSMKE